MKYIAPLFFTALTAFITTSFPALALAADAVSMPAENPFNPWAIGAIACIVIFVISYILVLFEEQIHMYKSIPVMVGAALIWITIAIISPEYGITHDQIHYAVQHNLVEYSSLLLFLLAAMTYIAAMEDRNVFDMLRVKLIQAGMNMRQMFWATGIVAFFLSPIADNLTTALVLGTVVMSVGAKDPKFVILACINVVNAANAGGAFSPFGDITTLMVWQAGKVEFFEFFALVLPSLANFLIPAIVMSLFVKKDLPEAVSEDTHLKRGAKGTIFLGIATIATAVSCEQFLGLPPFLGMLAGLSFLMAYSYRIKVTGEGRVDDNYDILHVVKRAEWDTLFFFYGVIFSVGGLAFLGYMELASTALYDNLGASVTNIILGVASAVIDNIPVMFAVLTMDPQMDHFQWLLITLTTGVGGSMLSIGSAAGVALMGIARGKYTFMAHLKWTPVLALGYIAAIAVHFLVNGDLVGVPLDAAATGDAGATH